MSRRLKFYLIGLIPGLLFVFFILGKKKVRFSYLPNDRVLAETLTKRFVFTDEFSLKMKTMKLSESFLKDSIFERGKIDFSRSNAQEYPCPQYVLIYPSKKPQYEISYKKCQEDAIFLDIARR